MLKKKNRTRKDKTEINRVRKTTAAIHKTNTRKVRAVAEAKPKVKAQAKVKATPKPQPQQKSAANRAEGIRLFKRAGRPSKEEFVVVYGERGPKMTWAERAAAGVPAAKFPAALAEKAASRRAPAK